MPLSKKVINKKNGLQVIGIIKLVSAVLLITLAGGIFNLLGGDIANRLEHYIRMLHLDMENKYINILFEKVSGINAEQLKRVEIVTFIYALLYITEGIGLILNKQWAEYLTIVVTGALIPFEIYEVARKLNAARMSILIINVIIVVYLIWRLRRDKLRESSFGNKQFLG